LHSPSIKRRLNESILVPYIPPRFKSWGIRRFSPSSALAGESPELVMPVTFGWRSRVPEGISCSQSPLDHQTNPAPQTRSSNGPTPSNSVAGFCPLKISTADTQSQSSKSARKARHWIPARSHSPSESAFLFPLELPTGPNREQTAAAVVAAAPAGSTTAKFTLGQVRPDLAGPSPSFPGRHHVQPREWPIPQGPSLAGFTPREHGSPKRRELRPPYRCCFSTGFFTSSASPFFLSTQPEKSQPSSVVSQTHPLGPR
jgi:hypothetical protein